MGIICDSKFNYFSERSIELNETVYIVYHLIRVLRNIKQKVNRNGRIRFQSHFSRSTHRLKNVYRAEIDLLFNGWKYIFMCRV